MVGEYGEANPDIVRRFARVTPGARYFVIPSSAHRFAWDNPEASVRAVREFLRDADAGRAAVRR